MTAPRVQLTVGRGQFPRTRIGIVRDSMQYVPRVCTLVLFIIVELMAQKVNEYITWKEFIKLHRIEGGAMCNVFVNLIS